MERLKTSLFPEISMQEQEREKKTILKIATRGQRRKSKPAERLWAGFQNKQSRGGKVV